MMIRESIESWRAILLAVEMFCLSGSVFAKSTNTKTVLQLCVIVLGVVAIASM